MEKTERLFLGLHLYPLFQSQIKECADRLRQVYPEQKWVNLENVHFTIHFLGDVSAEKQRQVSLIARKVAAATLPFEIGLEGMGAFPSFNKPRIVWIGAAPFCRPHLEQLYQSVTRPLIQEGLPVEHETFTPHATLFRVRAENPIIWDETVFQFAASPLKPVSDLILFKSTLTIWGSEYIPVESYPFAG